MSDPATTTVAPMPKKKRRLLRWRLLTLLGRIEEQNPEHPERAAAARGWCGSAARALSKCGAASRAAWA